MDNLILLLFLALVSCGFCIDIDTFYKYLKTNSTSNDECETQKDVFIHALENRDTWALKMLDSFGRIPQAVTQGNNIDMGTYDQCVNIFENLDNGDIKGKYCYGGLILQMVDMEFKELEASDMLQQRITEIADPKLAPVTVAHEAYDATASTLLLIAACIPNACAPSDFFLLANDGMCQTKNETKILDVSDIACLCFFGLVLLAVIASTIYDLYLEKQSKVASYKILLAFSAYTNGKKIMKTNNQPGQILFFNGFKVFSMFWVITGHRYSYYGSFAINKQDTEEWQRGWYSFYVILAPKAVETFFFVTGALMSYTFLKAMLKQKQKFNIFMYYLHRYLRLTPALAVLYFFQVTIVRRIGTGPLYKSLFDSRRTPCIKYWWSFFLYIQNYVNPNEMCMQHTWYLSVDMQLFILSPLLLLPLIRYKLKSFYTLISSFTLAFTIYTMLFNYYYETDSAAASSMISFSIRSGLTPWLIGIAMGALMSQHQSNELRFQVKNKTLIMSGWAIMFGVMAFIFLYNNDATYNASRLWSSIYFPLQKVLWALCLSWISFACLDGHGGFINWFLSLPVFQVLSKVTYSTYLIHVSLLMLQFATERTLPYFTDYGGIRHAIADIFVCCLFGTLWTLAFESPMIVVEQVIFGKRKARSTHNNLAKEGEKEVCASSERNNV